MAKKQWRKNRRRSRGHPPGALIYTGNLENAPSDFRLYQYDAETLTTASETSLETLLDKMKPGKKSWLKLTGLNQIENIRKIGAHFKVSPLVLEDILDTAQRPKSTIYNDYLFFSLKMLHQNAAAENMEKYQQISILLFEHAIVTFSEVQDEWFDSLIQRLEKNDTLLRAKPIDYLFYRMIDIAVDEFYVEIDELEERIEDLELGLDRKQGDEGLREIQQLKRDLIVLRKNVYPLREALSSVRKESGLISEETNHYMSDVYEHTIHIVETIETYRDLTSGLLDLYMTGISNRMNEIMKVLTIIATIFIPLTFIAGVYGMNFDYMPELHQKWAYPATLIVMALVALAMLYYFKRKKWI